MLNPGQQKTFGLSCTNSSGNISPGTEITIIKGVAPAAPLPTASLSVEVTGVPFPYGPAPTNYGLALNQNVEKLTWHSNNAIACEGDGFDTGNQPSGVIISPHADLVINPGETKVYRVRCHNANNDWSDWVRVGFVKSNLPPPLPNQAPDNPIVRGVDRLTAALILGQPNQLITFTVFAVDPDGDNLYYEIDLNEDGAVDIRLPGVGSVPSDRAESFVRSWSAEGVYRLRARATDVNGNRSGWTPHEIEIKTTVVSAPPPLPVSITIVPERNLIRHRETTDLRIRTTADYEALCTLAGPTTGLVTFTHTGAPTTQQHVYNSGVLTASQRFAVSCVPTLPNVAASAAETRVNVIPLVQEI